MPLAKVKGTVETLPVDEQDGVIRLENGEPVFFTDSVVSNEFTWDVVGPIEAGKAVLVWAIRFKGAEGYTATHIESTLEPFVGDEIMDAMVNDPDSLRLRKALFDPMQHDARERMDRSIEAME